MKGKKLLHVCVIALLAFSSVLAFSTAAASAEGWYSFITKWGSSGTGDGQFNAPYGVAVDSSGNVFVADRSNNRIQKFDSGGTFITEWGSEGSGYGKFDEPVGIAVDSSGYVFVADTYNHRIQKFDSIGTYITKWGSYGTGDGQFKYPSGVAVDSSGNVFVADIYNNRIQKFDSSGTFITKWGSSGSGDGQFDNPYGVAIVDSSGNVFVADTNNNRIQVFDSGGAYITKWGSYGTGDGQFKYPVDVAVDSSGNVFVADTWNHRIQKFDSSGTFITKWGSSGSGDGQFKYPCGVGVDSSGDVFVADTNNNRIQKFGFELAPAISVTKTASLTGSCPGSDPLAVSIGDTVTYCFNVINTGDVILTNVAVVDDIYGPVSFGTTKLAPGETTEGTLTHVVMESDAPSVTDIATATGTDPLGGSVTDTDPCTINVTISPEITVNKTASLTGTCPGSDPLAVSVGDTVTYCFIVTNTGDVTLTSVTVNDDVYGPVTLGTTTLAPGETTGGTLTHTVVESDAPSVTDTATATGTPPVGAEVTDTDPCTINVAISPEITVNTTASLTGTCPGSDPLAVSVGDTVTYCFIVTNTGDVTLTGVTVNDDIYGAVTLGTTTLAPGETTEGTITHIVVESDAPSVTNIATATATDPLAGTVTDTDDCMIHVDCPEASWTFMVYLAGDNNLEGAGIDDFLEMSSVGSSSAVNIVVQFDRIPGYDDSYGDWTSCKRFYVTPEMTPTPANATSDLDECNMGDPNTLDEFVTWAMTEYPAENYALILWNHGSGWKKFAPGDEKTGRGVCWDVTNGGDYLTLQETELALTGKLVQLLGYDAGLMHMIEVVYQVMDNAGISAGSEETEPWDGWPYNTILDDLTGTPTMTPSTLGATIVSRYIEYYPSETQSAVDNVDLLGLVTAVDNLAQALISELSGNYNKIKEARDNVQDFYDFDYIDLYHFAELIKFVPGAGSAAQAVMDNVDTTVYAEAHGPWYPNAHGLSIYFPKTEVCYLTSYENTEFAIATKWDEFLKRYYEGPEPTIAITTDKYEYHPGDTMTITMDIENPTASSVDTYFVLLLILPDYSYQKPMLVTRLTLPPYFDQTYNNDIYVGNWATIGFNAEWYVALLETSTPYGIICDDTAEWRYDPNHVRSRDKDSSKGGSAPSEEVVPEQIAEAIMKSIGKIALPVELAQEEEITEEILDAILD